MMNNLSLLPSGKNKIIKITSNSFLVPVQNVQKKKVDLGVKQKFTKVQKNNILKDIEKKVIRIDSLLKHSLTLRKKLAEKKRIKKSESSFESREKELEKKKPKDEDGVKSIPLPKSGGIFGWISNFIFNTILGFLAVRLIKHLPTMLKIVPVISKVMDGIIDWGGKLLDGLVTFIDWGYKTYENTAKFFYKVGGEKSEKTFRDFMSKFQSMIQYSIIAGMLFSDISSSGGGGGGGLINSAVDFAGEQIGKRVFQQAGRQVVQQTATTVTRTVGMTAGAAAAIVAGVGLLASALGEGAFQLRKYTKSLEKDALKKRSEAAKDKNPFTRPFKLLFFDAFAIPGMRITNFFLNGIGVTLDIIGAPFRYAIEVIRWAFMALNGDKKGMEEQRKNLGKFDARIRDGIRENFATFLGPFFRLIGKKDWANGIEKKGSWGSLFGDKAVKDMYGYAQGGPTRGSKKVDSQIQRGTGVEKKAKRTVVTKPTKLQQGSKVGGLNEIKKVFPEPQNINQPPGTPSQTKEQTMNPFGFVSHSYYRLSSVPFLGPILAMPLKVIMGDSIDSNYYKSTGQGFNSLINKAYNEGAFSEGFSFEGNDFEKIITKSVEELSSKEMRTLNMQLMKQLMLKKIQIQNGKPSSDCPCPETDGSGGGGSSASYGSAEERALLDAIAFAEGTAGPNGYRTMFGGGLFNAPPWQHPDKVINGGRYSSAAAGRYQFMPGTWNAVSKKLGLSDFSPANQDKGAIEKARERGVTDADLKREGLSDRLIAKLSPEWASFPTLSGSSYYGQPVKRVQGIRQRYQQSLTGGSATALKGPTGSSPISPSSPAGNVSDCSCDGDNMPDTGQIDTKTGDAPDSTTGNPNQKMMFLHWTAGSHKDSAPGPDNYGYHTYITGPSGTPVYYKPYGTTPPYHTYGRNNKNSASISASGMAGSSEDNTRSWGSQAITAAQWNSMAAEAAKLALKWGWKSSDINDKKVRTHSEEYRDHPSWYDRSVPSYYRWDLNRLYPGDPKNSGGDKIRSMIKSKMGSAGKFGGGYVSEEGLQKTHYGEFVIDADSVKLFGKDFMEIINQVENKTQLRSAQQSLIQMIQEIVPGYSDRSPDEIVMVPSSKTFGSKTIIDNRKYVFGNNSSDSSNPFDSLAFGN